MTGKGTKSVFSQLPPVEGEETSSCISICLPSPLVREGRGRGKFPNFSHLQGAEGGFRNAVSKVGNHTNKMIS
jgi:hypothetical protein